MNFDSLEKELGRYFQFLGEDPQREGLRNTPKRYLESLKELTSGYREDLENFAKDSVLKDSSKTMVLVKDIEFYSLCEHHLLPFFGRCHVAYLPEDRVISLSKIPQIVDLFSRRLQIQERLTEDISHFIENISKAKGVAVVVEAKHLCMSMRGIRKENAYLTTSSMRGSFLEAKIQNEFYTYLQLKSARG